MSVLGWILAALLAAFFLGAGTMKLLTSRAKLLTNPAMGWAADFTEPQIKAIAALEVLGAVGVVVPWLVDTARILTPIAATGLGVIMIGAIVVHGRRHETKALPVNVVALLLAIAVAAIRFSQL